MKKLIFLSILLSFLMQTNIYCAAAPTAFGKDGIRDQLIIAHANLEKGNLWEAEDALRRAKAILRNIPEFKEVFKDKIIQLREEINKKRSARLMV